MAELETKTIHSVAKAIRLLDLLAEPDQARHAHRALSGDGLAEKHDSRASFHDARGGLIEQMPNGRYWLGIRLFEYGCAVSNAWDIRLDRAPAYAEKSARSSGESVFPVRFLIARRVVAGRGEESRASLRVVFEVGARLPIHCTSQGKLFLANLSQAECRRLLSISEFKPYTPHTLTSSEQLQPELQKIREQGYAVENRGIQGRPALGFRAGA